MTRRARIVFPALALAVASAVTACGDDDDEPADTSEPVAAATAGTDPATTEPAGTPTPAGSTAPTGTSGDAAPSSPEDVVASYFAALAASDGATACALVNPDDMSNLDIEPATCADDLSTRFSADEQAVFAEVEIVGEVLVESEQCDPGSPDEGNTAVEITARGENECVSLVLVGDEWLIEDL